MRFVSWNVNGLRACRKKGFDEFFGSIGADIFCIQETKLFPEQMEFHPKGYEVFLNSAEKAGYSGTACFTKNKPVSFSFGIGKDMHDHEGRVITLEYDKFYLVNCYVPNSQEELRRLSYRMIFEKDFLRYLKKLDERKPVILCGDLNVAHTEIDLKNPRSNRNNAGFTDEERNCFSILLSSGFTDTFRMLNPETIKYSWWSYRFNARANNAGWRIDYFVVSNRLSHKISLSEILTDVSGSDHCPVILEADL